MISAIRRFMCPKFFLISLLALGMALLICGPGSARPAETTVHDPWDKAQVIMPEELAKLLASPVEKKPLLVYVGFEFLYKGAHIPGAQYFGPGREAKGIEALKKWAGEIPPDEEVVIYCGCCPLKDCPNIRPAFQALHQLGLTRLKILYLEDNFAKNWVEKGFPVEKGSERK